MFPAIYGEECAALDLTQDGIADDILRAWSGGDIVTPFHF